MKRNVWGSLLLIGLLTACTGANHYVINGTLENGRDSSVIYLTELVEGIGVVPIDSTYLMDGKFSFKGEQDTAAIRFLFFPNENGALRNCMIVLEKGELQVELGPETVVHGSPNNDAVREYYKTMRDISSKYQNVQQKVESDTMLSDEERNTFYMQMATTMEKEVKAVMMDRIIKNISNPFGAYLLKSLYDTLDPSAILPLFDMVPPEYKDQSFLSAQKIVATTLQRQDADKKTAAGKMFVDFKMNDANGETVSLSSIVGTNKYTLLYFWASWHENYSEDLPALKKAYETYNKKGLDIIGISLDAVESDWKKAIETNDLKWTQLSDLQGANNAAAQIYGVVYIPYMILIGSDGIILEKDIKANQLEEKLKKYIK